MTKVGSVVVEKEPEMSWPAPTGGGDDAVASKWSATLRT
jgi:hypothetical protein